MVKVSDDLLAEQHDKYESNSRKELDAEPVQNRWKVNLTARFVPRVLLKI